LAVDASNALYVADTGNNRVLKFNTPLTSIIPSANLVFGQGGAFNVNGCNQNSSPSNGTLCGPVGAAVNGLGDVFIADTGNNRVLMFKPPIASIPLANFVMGQTSFSSTQCNGGFGIPPSNATLCGPRGVATDSGNTNLLIADTGNNRVLRWPYSATTGPAATANLVLGQPDFAHTSANTVDANALSGPTAVAIDRSVTPNHLWVVDTNNNRVLGYTSAATFTTYSAANIVIGQPDFFSGSSNQGSFSGPTAKTLSAPNAAAVDAVGNLFVADGGNNRVLMYPKPFLSGIKANQAATVVFGQAGLFTTNTGVCPPNNACPTLPPPGGTATQGGMCLPSGVALGPGASGPLYVSDENNNRVLVFKPPFSANPLPTLVVGQANFTANYSNRDNTCGFIFPAANSLAGPDQIATDAVGNLYVGDTDNSRTLEFAAPSASGASASHVFGQLGNFTGSDCNLDSEERTIGAATLCNAEGMAADPSKAPNNLYIADTGNNRILWYSNPLVTGTTTAELVIGQPSFFTNSCNFGGWAPSCKSLCGPLTPAVDSVGNLYIPDFGNNRVLEYDKPDPPVATPKPTPKPTPRPTPTPKPTVPAPKATSNTILR
jgi:sugar lactone lactonase YvrE